MNYKSSKNNKTNSKYPIIKIHIYTYYKTYNNLKLPLFSNPIIQILNISYFNNTYSILILQSLFLT